MTKPLPYGCIKIPSLGDFNRTLDSVSHDSNIGHTFTVDIKFHKINKKNIVI